MEQNKNTSLTVPIHGMHCASCASNIEKTLKKQEGVASCEVSIGTEKAKIQFDPTKTDLKKLSSSIEKLGYSLEHQDHSQMDHSKMSHDEHNMSAMDHSAHLGINQTKQQKLSELKSMKLKLLFAIPASFSVFFIMLWEIANKSFGLGSMFPVSDEIMDPLIFIIASVSLFWIGMDFLKEVIVFIKHKVANMYTLVGIGTFTAYIYSAILFLFPKIHDLLSLPEEMYFDVTIVVIGFIFLGKYLEMRSKLKTGDAVEKLLQLQAKTAFVEENGVVLEKPIDQIQKGDLIVVKAGEKFPVDGVITFGNGSIDESMITGEPIPVDKSVGQKVIAGTINKNGLIKFTAEKVGNETLLASIIKMVEEAQGSKAPIQSLADKISAVFVPIVLVLSIITLFGWLTIGTYFLGFDEALSFGILCFVGVLVIACPCALGLATPTGIIVGVGKGATNGILIKNAESLEKLSKVKTVIVDKTGTITIGKPAVQKIVSLKKDFSENEILKITASIEHSSTHPLALAIVDEAKKQNIEFDTNVDAKTFEGKGISGIVNSTEYFVGNAKFIEDQNLNIPEELKALVNEGNSIIFLSTNSEVFGAITIADELKENIKQSIEKLKRMGIQVVMLTGDNRSTAQKIAELSGIEKYYAEVLPKDKGDLVNKIKAETGTLVAMVGDGINDAVALSSSDVGIAMGTGTDVAIESADIILLNGDFSKILKAIKLSKFTLRAIKQNLFWAFFYNIAGIPLAAGVFYPVFKEVLNPAFAGMAMALSSVSVISNSLRLKFAKL